MTPRLAGAGAFAGLFLTSSLLWAESNVSRIPGAESAFEAIAEIRPLFSAIARPEPLAFSATADFSATASPTLLAVMRGDAALLSPARGRRSRSTAGFSAVTSSAAQTAEEAALSEGFGDAFPASADDDLQAGFDAGFGSGDDLQSGFGGFEPGGLQAGFEDPPALGAPTALVEDNPFYELTGSLSFGAAYNFAQDSPDPGEADFRGLSRLRTQADLQLDLELPLGLSARIAGRGFRDLSYAIKGRDDFTHEVLQVYESELEFKELYLQGSLASNVDFRVGRQVLAWGSSETLRVLDVLSPIDNREPGLVDLRDLRLPVAATQVSYFNGPFELTGVAIHESRFDETPPFGSDFFPFEMRPPGESRPANGGSDTEVGIALTGRFSSFDASLNWARYFDDEPHLSRDSGLLEHSDLRLIGASVDVPVGNFLLRSEVARIRGVEFFGSRRKLSRSDALLGIEYSGLSEATVTLELVARKLHGFDDAILDGPDAARENTFEGSLRYSASYLNDRARLTALFIVMGQQAQDGTTFRLTFDYDIFDAFTIGGGVLIFEEGDLPPFNVVDENDRVFVNVRYSF